MSTNKWEQSKYDSFNLQGTIRLNIVFFFFLNFIYTRNANQHILCYLLEWQS